MQSFFNKFFGRSVNQDAETSAPSSRGFYSSVQVGSEHSNRAQLVHIVMRELLSESGVPPGWIVCQPQMINSRSRGQGIFVRLAVKHWDDRLMHYAFAFQKALLTGIVRYEPDAATWLHGIAWQLEVASTCPHTELPHRDSWLEEPPRATVGSQAAPRQTLVAPIAFTSPITPRTPLASIAPRTQAPPPESGLTAHHLTNSEPKVALMPFVNEATFDIILPNSVTKKTAIDDDAMQDLERLFAVRDRELARNDSRQLARKGYESTEPAPLA